LTGFGCVPILATADLIVFGAEVVVVDLLSPVDVVVVGLLSPVDVVGAGEEYPEDVDGA